MNDINANGRAGRRHHREMAATAICSYVAEHRSALWNAARLLGGYERAALVDRLADELSQAPRLSSRGRLLLDQLLSLLTLQNAHDPDGVEAGFFAVIDPADPVVEEICLLADGLRNAMDRSYALGQEQAPAGLRAA